MIRIHVLITIARLLLLSFSLIVCEQSAIRSAIAQAKPEIQLKSNIKSEIANDYNQIHDISYVSENETDPYRKSRCKLDLYFPTKVKSFPVIVWFHGGGLTGGSKSIPAELKNQGVAVVAVNYRLSPKASAIASIDDAAEAVAWTFKNIEKYGGSPNKIFVAGHSAGGYLTMMIGLDKKWLAKYQIDANAIAGLIPFSGHTITHMTIRAEQGIADKTPVVDQYAPLHFVRKDAPPMLLITGDRELEMLGRYEENAYFWRMMKVIGHENTTLYELDGYNHGGMAQPAHPLMLKFIREILSKSNKS